MSFLGEASAPTEGFLHPALIYGSDQEFMEVTLPLVEEGSPVRSQRSSPFRPAT